MNQAVAGAYLFGGDTAWDWERRVSGRFGDERMVGRVKKGGRQTDLEGPTWCGFESL